MLDKDINNSIRKGVKIGKWFIGTALLFNLATYTVIGFLVYKYVYIDWIASRYNGSDNQESIISYKFNLVYSFEEGLKKLLPNTLIVDSNKERVKNDEMIKSLQYPSYSTLAKDQFGNIMTKECTNISDDIIDELVNEPSKISKALSQNAIDSKYLYFNKQTQTAMFLNSSCHTALAQMTGELVDHNNKKILDIQRLTLSLSSGYSPLSLNLQRKRGEYAILKNHIGLLDGYNNQVFYHYKTESFIYVNGDGHTITIYTKKYIEDISNILRKELNNGGNIENLQLLDSNRLNDIEHNFLYKAKDYKLISKIKTKEDLKEHKEWDRSESYMKKYNDIINFYNNLQKEAFSNPLW